METVREISCSISECGRAAEVKGYCKRHYLKWYRYGDPLYGRTNQAVPTDRVCTVNGCGREYRASGYCSAHWSRFKLYGNPLVTKHRKGCVVEGCEGEHMARGWCQKHYARFKKHGDIDVVKYNIGSGDTTEERFWSKVAITANPDKCWEWQAGINTHDYGAFYFNGRHQGTHRVAWTLANGREPQQGMFILHSCDNRRCCNPNHLREGTPKENTWDAIQRKRFGGIRRRRTPLWADMERIEEIYKNCPEGYQVDHIVPLRGEYVSGLHVPYNLQYLPVTQNLQKKNRFDPHILFGSLQFMCEEIDKKLDQELRGLS